jgi:hypothetical protein
MSLKTKFDKGMFFSTPFIFYQETKLLIPEECDFIKRKVQHYVLMAIIHPDKAFENDVYGKTFKFCFCIFLVYVKLDLKRLAPINWGGVKGPNLHCSGVEIL